MKNQTPRMNSFSIQSGTLAVFLGLFLHLMRCPVQGFVLFHKRVKLRETVRQRIEHTRATATIRDYQEGDANAIQQLLDTSSFDPEGPLNADCGSHASIRESYLEDGCFLVATDEDDDRIVGTAGLMVGTIVSNLASGASVFSPNIVTGAVRRVSGLSPALCEQLINELELRAKNQQVHELIALGYPSGQQRPTKALLQKLKYELTENQLPGVDVVQFRKRLDTPKTPSARYDRNMEEQPAQGLLEGVQEAVLAGFLVLVFVASTAVAQFMGLDVFSNQNSDLGSPLTSQELSRLRQDEQLKRTTLDQAEDRQWQDLSMEEQREEVALMQVIQGRNIRVK